MNSKVVHSIWVLFYDACSLVSLSFAAGEGFRRFNVEFAISNNLIRKHLPILVLQGMHWSCRVSLCEPHEFAGQPRFSLDAVLWWVRGHQVKNKGISVKCI